MQLTFDDVPAEEIPAEAPEEWRDVVGYENYQVSSLGRIWSKPRMSANGRYPVGGRFRVLSLWQSPTSPGYFLYQVRLGAADGSKKTLKVHQLVARAFHGACPAGQVVRHGPNGSLDNRTSQICYGDMKQNNGDDKARDGTLPIGEAHGMAKLTMEIVGECRRRCAAGATHADLAAEFGVGEAAMGLAISGRNWTTCPVPPVNGSRTGARHQRAKLTEGMVIEARRRHAAGELVNTLAKEYGLRWATVNNAVRGTSWRDVPMPGAVSTSDLR